MAKQVKKKQDATANPRSRAAKRATSPSIDVDKSIKETPRALGTSPLLGVTHNSGISKKRKVKHMTRGQRVRQEKGLARAEAVMDQMERKVDDAKTKLKKRHVRKALWEEVNDATADEKRKAIKAPGRDVLVEDGAPEGVEKDIDMNNSKSQAPATVSPTTTPALGVQNVTRDIIESRQPDEIDLIT